MKIIFALFVLLLGSCINNAKEEKEALNASIKTIDSTVANADNSMEKVIVPPDVAPEYFSNDRFKFVTVTKVSANEYVVEGSARVFEATLNWVIEDGHEEIDSGYHTTNAGAPEWGNFKFRLKIKKKGPDSPLHLILFETSAKDGSRQSELPIPL